MCRETPNKEIIAFWNDCCAQLPQEKMAQHQDIPEAWGFGDDPRMADELGALVLEGRKTATCGILWEYEAEGEAIPQPGEFSIILNGANQPLCLIENTEVHIVPFDQVTPRFAFEEGEDDRTLESCRREHWKFFSRYLAEIGRHPSMDMPLVCERFRLVFKLEDVKKDKDD